MDALVAALRRMTGVGTSQYTIGGHTYWSDDDLEAVLAEKVTVQLLQTPIVPTYTLDGSGDRVVLHGSVSVAGALDVKGAVVTARDGEEVEATVHSDGRVEYAESQSGTAPLLSAVAYDLSGAGADVLHAWAAAVADGYDVTLDGQTLRRSQRHAQLLKQAEALQSRAIRSYSAPSTVKLTRSDVRHRGSK